jgi:hypothetical protein
MIAATVLTATAVALAAVLVDYWPRWRAHRLKPHTSPAAIAHDTAQMIGVWGNGGLWDHVRDTIAEMPPGYCAEQYRRERPVISRHFRDAMRGYTKLWVRCHATVDAPSTDGDTQRAQTQHPAGAVECPDNAAPAGPPRPPRIRVTLDETTLRLHRIGVR